MSVISWTKTFHTAAQASIMSDYNQQYWGFVLCIEMFSEANEACSLPGAFTQLFLTFKMYLRPWERWFFLSILWESFYFPGLTRQRSSVFNFLRLYKGLIFPSVCFTAVLIPLLVPNFPSSPSFCFTVVCLLLVTLIALFSYK